MIFFAKSEEGKFFMNDYMGAMFRQHLKDNKGMRYKITPILPESKNMRGYLEGGLLPMFCYFQDDLDHRNPDHIVWAREFLKKQLNGETHIIKGRAEVVGGSTKGSERLNRFVEKVVDMLTDDYGCPMEAINPEAYKKWRDEILPYGGPDNWIDYLKSNNQLPVDK
jgi:hypothetical protein